MGMIFEDFWIELVIGLTIFFVFFYYAWTAKYNYWKERNIPYVEPTFPFGNTKGFLLSQEFIGISFKKLYFQLKGMNYSTDYLIPEILSAFFNILNREQI